MSLFFAFTSESQLRHGLPWATRFAEHRQLSVTLLVLGTQRSTLVEHARSLTSEDPLIDNVATCDADAATVLDKLRDGSASLVLLMHDDDGAALTPEIMSQCPVPVIALRCNGEPPSSASHVFALDSATHNSIHAISASTIGFAPDLCLLDDRDVGDATNDVSILDAALAAESARCESGDLVWVDASCTHVDGQQLANRLLAKAVHASVAVYEPGHPLVESTAAKIRYWATHVAEPMSREQRKELASALEVGSEPNLEFLGLISASAMLAAFGLLQDSAAVIIGAMLIAPLMTPILGAGMSLTHGNRPLFQSACLTITLGFVGALVSSYLFGLLYVVTHMGEDIGATGEMLARSHPTVLDFCVGLVGGMAASYARTRSHLSSALAGAAIAAALVPPISTAGLQVAFGQWESTDDTWPVFGPLLLVTINVLTIMIGSSFVLYARGMRISKAGNSKDKWPLRMAALIVVLLLMVAVSL